MTRWLLQIARWVFTPFIALLLIFEEWGWEPLSRWLKYLVGLPFWAGMWAALATWIARLPPWAALLLLVMPTALLFPIKLGALVLMRHGYYATGITVLVLAKIVGTALLARLFALTQPALMQWAWFAHWYPRWKNWKDSVMLSVRGSAAWKAAAVVKIKLSSILKKTNPP